MTKIVLVRHAPVKIDPNTRADTWDLSPESKQLCQALAAAIRVYNLQWIYTSSEPKAIQTGAFIAHSLGIERITAPHLQETERHTKHFYASQDNFRAAVRQAMSEPDKVVFGDEAFSVARTRLEKQLARLADNHTGKTFGVVSHGRILAMFLGKVLAQSPISIWENLKMPAYAVLSWDKMKIETLVNSVEG